MTTDTRRGEWRTVFSGDGLRVDSITPSHGVLVLAVVGACAAAAHRSLARCLSEQVMTGPSVLLLDLSRLTAFDENGARILLAAGRIARRCRVAVELVVSSYGVAKPIQLSDPDLLRRAWPSLDAALATVCGSVSPGSFRPTTPSHERHGYT